MKREEEVAVTQHYFFKVMMPGFHQKLRLPPAISKEIRKGKSRRATLKSRLGKWKISLCSSASGSDDDDLICFNKGWPEFVHRHALTIGDFLYFEPTRTAHLHFHVYVFGSTACEKEFPNHPITQDQITEDEDKDKDEDEKQKDTTKHNKREGGDGTPNSYFEKKMVISSAPNRIRIGIPKEFMRSNNLGLRMSATLRDPSGKAWPMHLVRDNKDLRIPTGNDRTMACFLCIQRSQRWRYMCFSSRASFVNSYYSLFRRSD